MIAASRARNKRKWEVMGEMRLMGRPVVDAQLMAVLDPDELPDMAAPPAPIYGRGELDGSCSSPRVRRTACGHDVRFRVCSKPSSAPNPRPLARFPPLLVSGMNYPPSPS